MTEQNNHNLNFQSGMYSFVVPVTFRNRIFLGMLQTWNKFCFTTGYVEVSLSLPGTSQTPGFWPGMRLSLVVVVQC